MDVVTTKLSAFKIQDIVVVVVCAVFIYILRARDSYILQPAWRKQLDRQAYANGKFPSSIEHVPRPIVTDLDGDDEVEIVLVTNELELQVCSVLQSTAHATKSDLDRRLPDLLVRYSTLLSADGNPVSLETGYLIPAKHDQYRSQVIVVVLDTWTVLCYDHRLNLLWVQRLMSVDHIKDQYSVKSMGLLITPHGLQPGDNGSVVVGGSFIHRDHGTRMKRLLSGEVSDESLVSGHTETLDKTADEQYTHFSTFLLSGSDGAVRWRHLPGDFVLDTPTDSSAHFHWKLGLRRGRWHVGEVHWTKYAHNILNHMPHSWSSLKDTRFDVSDLRKSGVVSDSESLTDLDDILDLDGEHVVGLLYGGMQPHSHHEHIKHPNAVVIHHHDGVEVLGIQTGRPLTRLHLSDHDAAATYVDVNEDGQLEAVRANFNLKCEAEVSTIEPRRRAVFTAPLCESPLWWGGVGLANIFNHVETVSEDTHLALKPVVVKRIARSRGVVNHLIGRRLASERKGFDSLFMTSTGRLTSYAPTGDPNWQVVVPSSWCDMAFNAETNHQFATTDIGDVYYNSFRPSVKPLSLQLYAKVSATLVSGWDSVTLVDLHEGHILSHHSLPCQSIDEPITADFNHDGWTDFIVTCPDGFVGFEIHKKSDLMYSVCLSVGIILGVVLLVWCCRPHHTD